MHVPAGTPTLLVVTVRQVVLLYWLLNSAAASVQLGTGKSVVTAVSHITGWASRGDPVRRSRCSLCARGNRLVQLGNWTWATDRNEIWGRSIRRGACGNRLIGGNVWRGTLQRNPAVRRRTLLLGTAQDGFCGVVRDCRFAASHLDPIRCGTWIYRATLYGLIRCLDFAATGRGPLIALRGAGKTAALHSGGADNYWGRTRRCFPGIGVACCLKRANLGRYVAGRYGGAAGGYIPIGRAWRFLFTR